MPTLSRLAASLVALSVAASPLDSQGWTQTPAAAGLPTARVCAIRDFGVPLQPGRPATADPIWFRETGTVTAAANGDLYGTAPSGGIKGRGVAFKVSPAGLLQVLYPFSGGVDGSAPQSGLTDGTDGYYYGTAYAGGKFATGTIFRIRSAGGTPETLIHFRNGSTAGLVPPCANRRCPFSPRQRADAAGGYPTSPPVRDRQGHFYGVTSYSNNQGFGVLYRLSPPYDSTGYRTLCIFDPRMRADSLMAGFVCAPNGTTPSAVVMSADSTTIFGTLTGGPGHVFGASLQGAVTIVHEFTAGDRARPYNVMQASNKVLYGTASTGGPGGGGFVYRVLPSGAGYQVMRSFGSGTSAGGSNPIAGLVEGKDTTTGKTDGFLYGATRYGGRERRGMLFRMPLDGDSASLRVLHDFDMAATGRSPIGTPLLHTDGKMYGFTYDGGAYGGGVLYRLSGVDFKEQTTQPALMSAGNLAKDDRGAQLTDTLVEVRTNVEAWQGAYKRDPRTSDGISVRVRCRNPHFVQFIYREKITTLGAWLAGTVTVSTGSYALTTDTANVVWHTDGSAKPDAYYEHGAVGRTVLTSGGLTSLKIFDQPTFDPPLFAAADQDPRFSQTWRATVKVYAVCNCEVQREVRWTTQMKNGKRTYSGIRILPATNASLGWINAQLARDGYRPVP